MSPGHLEMSPKIFGRGSEGGTGHRSLPCEFLLWLPMVSEVQKIKEFGAGFPMTAYPSTRQLSGVCQSTGSTKIILEFLFAFINVLWCWTALHPATLSALSLSSLKRREMQTWQMVLGSDLYSKASRVKV